MGESTEDRLNGASTKLIIVDILIQCVESTSVKAAMTSPHYSSTSFLRRNLRTNRIPSKESPVEAVRLLHWSRERGYFLYLC